MFKLPHSGYVFFTTLEVTVDCIPSLYFGFAVLVSSYLVLEIAF